MHLPHEEFLRHMANCDKNPNSESQLEERMFLVSFKYSAYDTQPAYGAQSAAYRPMTLRSEIDSIQLAAWINVKEGITWHFIARIQSQILQIKREYNRDITDVKVLSITPMNKELP
ncbi:hypothetical protein [Escherichia phage FEC19]|uniref:Uncharacterized protein n=1 Tax=Escherichia phage FEC19 TaxID=2315486 RepID=A0A386KM45_9CAUD|nr:hypothetical protein HOU28_gp12 [Escherichia phage FEC19]AYD85441.1 hypothetical protein [Escherichia phage FEC19]